jgi:uncharacterized protein YvpB
MMKKYTMLFTFSLSIFAFFACKKESIISNPPIEIVNHKIDCTLPNDILVGKGINLEGLASEKITKIAIFLETDSLGSANVANGKWSFFHTFKKSNANAKLLLKGFDDKGKLLYMNTKTVAINESSVSSPYLTDVPYFYQYENKNNPSGSCQNTCVAMILKYYAQKEGKNTIANDITPDVISTKWGTKKAQSVTGMEDLFNKEAESLGLNVREKGTEKATLAEFQKIVTAGKPIVVHGYFTSFGHILVVLGFDGTHYICNDPAGKWSQKYKNGGYNTTNNSEGVAIKYAKTAFEEALSPDGLVWMHTY